MTTNKSGRTHTPARTHAPSLNAGCRSAHGAASQGIHRRLTCSRSTLGSGRCVRASARSACATYSRTNAVRVGEPDHITQHRSCVPSLRTSGTVKRPPLTMPGSCATSGPAVDVLVRRRTQGMHMAGETHQVR